MSDYDDVDMDFTKDYFNFYYYSLFQNEFIDEDKIQEAFRMLKKVIDNYEDICCLGNGGSGYTASHFSQDLVKVCNAYSQGLNDATGLITAVANDIGYEDIFSYQLERTSCQLLIVISHSGNSLNVVKAINYALEENINIIALTGSSGGLVGKLLDKHDKCVHININSNNIFVVESIHSMILHYFVDILSKENKEE